MYMKKKNKVAKPITDAAGFDIKSDDAWSAYEDLLENFGAAKVLDEMAKAMSTDNLADLIAGICRDWDYPSPYLVGQDDEIIEDSKQVKDYDEDEYDYDDPAIEYESDIVSIPFKIKFNEYLVEGYAAVNVQYTIESVHGGDANSFDDPPWAEYTLTSIEDAEIEGVEIEGIEIDGNYIEDEELYSEIEKAIAADQFRDLFSILDYGKLADELIDEHGFEYGL